MELLQCHLTLGVVCSTTSPPTCLRLKIDSEQSCAIPAPVFWLIVSAHSRLQILAF